MKQSRVVSVERVIPASAQEIFDLLADPAMHPILDGSGTVKKAPERNPQRLSLGAKFGMGMRAGAPYRTRNRVVEFEEGKRIAWHHPARNIWRYELEPTEGGTLVRESFDYSRSRTVLLVKHAKFPERNRSAMEKTLENIERYLADRRRS
jgi:uncharacterized protein YndB with AHSA1/START domain